MRSCCILLKIAVCFLHCYTCVKNSYSVTNTCSYCLCHHQHHTPKTKPTPTLTVPQAERGPGRATRCGRPARGGGLRCTVPQSSRCTPYPTHCTYKCFVNDQSTMSLHQGTQRHRFTPGFSSQWYKNQDL